ncbi:MAG: phosphodiester glycosidase family protein [Byssovorax sp.]
MSTPAPKPRRRRRALIALGVAGAGVPALWFAINHVPWLGPVLADGARAVLGPGPVAWLEDTAYALQDRIDRIRYKDAPPKTFWEAPEAPSGAPAAALPSAEAQAEKPAEPGAQPVYDGFPPPPFQAPFSNVAAQGDGTWIAMKEPGMAKSLVHPDPKRSFAAVAVVAIDLRRIDLKMVAGTTEPSSTSVKSDHRPGLIPKEAGDALIAAFNGGFKTTHGHYGMMLDGETFVPPRDISCTVGLYKDGSIRIRTWPELKPSEPDMLGYRQTPPCLVEQGKTNTVLDTGEYNRNWGAAVGGETVIRRSAIGIDKDGHTLFYGFGDAVTAQSLSQAMKAIGAMDAAQLDVNYSYPRFLLYERPAPDAPPKAASSLVPGVKFVSREYVEEPSPRDFFYLVRRKQTS